MHCDLALLSLLPSTYNYINYKQKVINGCTLRMQNRKCNLLTTMYYLPRINKNVT